MTELKKVAVAEWCFIPEGGDCAVIPPLRDILEKFEPNIVIVPTDRKEAVYAAAYCFHNNYVVAHFHAGNNPANHPDDINRRVISCFSHIMLCNMPEHKQNLIAAGEEEWRIHIVGSTAFDDIVFDDSLTPKEPFDLVILHPNPSSATNTEQDLQNTIEEIKWSPKIVWIYPNNDKNHEIIENFLDAQGARIIKYKSLPRNQYFSILKNCYRAVGNSSSFYYEMPVLDSSHDKLVQIGERNKGLQVPPTVTGGSKKIAELLTRILIDDKLRKKLII